VTGIWFNVDNAMLCNSGTSIATMKIYTEQ